MQPPSRSYGGEPLPMIERAWDAEQYDQWTIVSIPESRMTAIQAALRNFDQMGNPPPIIRTVIRTWAREYCRYGYSVIGWEIDNPGSLPTEMEMGYRVAFEDPRDAFAFKVRWG